MAALFQSKLINMLNLARHACRNDSKCPCRMHHVIFRVEAEVEEKESLNKFADDVPYCKWVHSSEPATNMGKSETCALRMVI